MLVSEGFWRDGMYLYSSLYLIFIFRIQVFLLLMLKEKKRSFFVTASSWLHYVFSLDTATGCVYHSKLLSRCTRDFVCYLLKSDRSVGDQTQSLTCWSSNHHWVITLVKFIFNFSGVRGIRDFIHILFCILLFSFNILGTAFYVCTNTGNSYYSIWYFQDKALVFLSQTF